MVKVALTPLSESEFIFLLNKHNHANYLKGGSLSDINIFRSKKKYKEVVEYLVSYPISVDVLSHFYQSIYSLLQKSLEKM